jgi:nitrogen fixation/metabolism regulation signal transduction histidine kinase
MKRKKAMTRRLRLLCLLLSLPGFLLATWLLWEWKTSPLTSGLALLGLLAYSGLIVGSILENVARPLQTLSNVVAALREEDYSFRARGARANDALGELAAEINALADLLQQSRVRTLEATALLAQIVETMNAPVFAIDRDEFIRLINPAGAQLLGKARDSCLGIRARHFGLEQVLSAPDEAVLTVKNSPARWMLRRTAFRQNGLPHTLLLLSDVTAPLQEEERLAWQKLVRVLGHELSNSLAPIKSIAGSLRSRIQGDEPAPGHMADFISGLTVIETRADALHRFVEAYRGLAQLPPPQLASVPLPPLLARIAGLETRVPVKLLSGPDATLRADAAQIEQMLINLLRNAAEASLSNGSDWVEVSWAQDGHDVLIDIDDRGPGIANRENLFVPFYTTKPGGSGVGLALAKQIAQAHGGTIHIANRDDDSGCRVQLRLPLIDRMAART